MPVRNPLRWVILSVSFQGHYIDDIKRVIGEFWSEGEALENAERMTQESGAKYSQITELVDVKDVGADGKGFILLDVDNDDWLCGFIVKRLLQEDH